MRPVSKAGCVVALCALTAVSVRAQGSGFKIIVQQEHPGTAIQKEQLAQIYLGEARSWGSGGKIRPVDQSAESAIRQAFSRNGLGRSVEAVKNYWKRQILSGGLRPPPVKETDADVIEFVGSTRGAIGYVSTGAQLPASVKELSIIE